MYEQQFQPQIKGLTGWLIKKGWAKDVKSAEIIQIIIAIIFFSLSFYFWFK